jgi:hypothetical protein
MKVTSVGFKRRMEFATVSLIRMSAPKLTDDMKVTKMWAVPLRVSSGTATIAECLQVKAMHA